MYTAKQTYSENEIQLNYGVETNHLGNVLVTVSAKPILNDSSGVVNFRTPDVMSVSDYEPFGSTMPGRSWDSGLGYRYGFNGYEKDDEMKGAGNWYSFGDYGYDPRIVQRPSPDPMASKYPQLSPYAAFGNNPILYIDKEGKEIWINNPNGGEPVLYVPNQTSVQEGINDFVRTTSQALDYIINSGLDKKDIVSTLVSDKNSVLINEVTWDTHINQTSGRIEWGTQGGIVTDDGKRQSPVIGLLHELGEAFFEFYQPTELSRSVPDPKNYKNNEEWNKAMDQYDAECDKEAGAYETINDKWVITEVENPAATEKGDATRNSHSYKEKYKAKDFKSTEGPAQSEIKKE